MLYTLLSPPAGLCYSLAQTVGPVLGGVLIHKLKLARRQQLVLVLSVLAINITLFLLLLGFGCGAGGGYQWQTEFSAAYVRPAA